TACSGIAVWTSARSARSNAANMLRTRTAFGCSDAATACGSARRRLVVEADVDDLAAADAVDAGLGPLMALLRRVRRHVVAHLDDERIRRDVDAEDVGAVDLAALLPAFARVDERGAASRHRLPVLLLGRVGSVQLENRVTVATRRAELREPLGNL